MPLTTKVLVTGHSRGLGAAIAEQLLSRGIPVLGCSRRSHPELCARFPDLLSEALFDLGDAEALCAWLGGETLAQFCAGAETLALVNNAGTLGPVGSCHSLAPDDIARAVQLNVAAPLMLSSALAAAPAGALRILHISSGAGRSPYAGWSAYCATKAALDHHAQAVAAERLPNLRICSLAPGVIDTDMQTRIRGTSEAQFPMLKKFQRLKQDGLLTSPEDAAKRTVAYLLSEDFGDAVIADLRELP